MIAALYVETDGAYYGLPDVDPWDEVRDARLYGGPWPVVAHPPCSRWSLMGLCRGYYDGQDDGCFEAALDAVRRFGGVLEHPAHSLAWRTFALPRPAATGWTRSLLDEGWTAEIDQRHYGHEARKPTWLYYIGEPPPQLVWGTAKRGATTVGRGFGGGREHLRARTPLAFRDLLLSLASPPSQTEGHPLRCPPMNVEPEPNGAESSSQSARTRSLGPGLHQLDAEHDAARPGPLDATQRLTVDNDHGRAAARRATGSSEDTATGEGLRSASRALAPSLGY